MTDAEQLSTDTSWEDLVLDAETRRAVEDIVRWERHAVIFIGPAGTLRSVAALIGEAKGCPVYRVDLSKLVSKYIGETEKNLSRIFDQAQRDGWLLFFDEADALFGHRSEARDSADRAANQQLAYLLQRIEEFPGVVILATNLETHLDDAFERRFQSKVHFPVPHREKP
jgi:SpoVK/Ycf46/Vps4 family AAA+-type ATPase